MSGQTIVILHGWQSKLSRWQPLIKILKKKFNVYLPHLPGFYKNKLKAPWDLKDYALWLNKYLLRKRIKNPILLGHSNGGRIALYFLAQGYQAEKLVLIASAGIKSKKNFKKIFFQFLARTGKKIFFTPLLNFLKKPSRWFFYTLIGEKDYYRAAGFLRPTLVNLIAKDLTPHLKKIKVPTLILWGRKDRLTPVNDAYLLASKIKNSKLIIYNNEGHDLLFKLPEEIASKIITFGKC